jgi:uncharacterized protein involved in exopolysaccharide biosynthesis
MNKTIKFYTKLLVRRLPAMALLFLICTGLGLVLAIRLPTTYQTEARLLVQAPQIDPNLAASTVQISASEEIEIIRQQLMTRANLIDIANDLNVFDDPGISPDDVVQTMRANTEITSRGGESRRGPTQPTIVNVSFSARTGPIAAAVVNEYVTRITAANVRNRTGAAENTLDFFQQEVERLSGELDLRSARITEFQRANAGALPDGQDYRLDRQSLLQERLAGLEREVSALTEQRGRLVELFESTGRVGPAAQQNLSAEQRRVAQLEAEITQALTVFSETNPRVTQLRAQLEQARAAAAATSTNAGADEGEDAQTTLYRLQLEEFDSRIAQLNERIPAITDELDALQAAVAETPLNAISLQSLQRNLDNTRQQYDSAVAGLARARVGEQIELTAQGQRITLIEAANVPSEPASPNRPLIAAAGVGAGLGMAAALFMLLELLNSAVRRPVDVQKGLGIVPLATIPYIESKARKMWRRSGQIAAMLIVLAGVPAALWAVDTYYLPLDLLAQRVLDRIGLA